MKGQCDGMTIILSHSFLEHVGNIACIMAMLLSVEMMHNYNLFWVNIGIL